METLTTLAGKVPTETAAYRYLEGLRWKGRPVCPHCGVIDGHYLMKARRRTSTGKVTQRRLWKCHACRKQFSVLVGTIFHGSKIPVRTWLFVLFEMSASKNGIAAREVQRKYGLSPKSAWFLTQRIREAMIDRRPDALIGTIVADEAYIGGRSKLVHGRLMSDEKPEKRIPHKVPVLALLNRDTGEVRTKIVPSVTAVNLAANIRAEVAMAKSALWTDEHPGYRVIGRKFGHGHSAVTHSMGEYVRGDVSTNALENWFGQLKRSLDGTHHAVSPEHLHRYCEEFAFRFTTRKMSDTDRMDLLVHLAAGRRLMYRPLTEAA